MERFYEIAGIVYRVAGDENAMCWDNGVLTPFICENKDFNRSITITIRENLTGPKGQLVFDDDFRQVYVDEDGTQVRYEGVIDKVWDAAGMRIERNGSESLIQVKPLSLGCKSVLKAMEVEHTSAENSGVLFHAACVKIKDKALIFTAPSGVGKSTQAQLWCDCKGAELINGDRCIIRRIDDKCYVCGVPYCGSSRVSKNLTLPLGAVVYVAQAPASKAQITSGIQSFMHLWEGCCINTWNSVDMERSVELVTWLAEKACVLRLDCTPDVAAVEELELLLKEMNVLGE